MLRYCTSGYCTSPTQLLTNRLAHFRVPVKAALLQLTSWCSVSRQDNFRRGLIERDADPKLS